GFKAVDDLSLYVEPNEIRAIIGPNGAGKTTLLDLITGKTRPTSGKVQFQTTDLIGMREHEIVRPGVGRKFQTPSVYEPLTVFEHREMCDPGARNGLGAWLFKRTQAVVEKVESVAELMGLKHELKATAGTLSHGQKQWLEIGMLLIQEPKLMLLDEPVAGMTDEERGRTGELLQSLAGRHSLVVVEHDVHFVESIARKVTVLHEGKVLAEGRMEQVRDNPRVIEVYLGR